MDVEEMAEAIREFFLLDGKWDDDEKGWLWLMDANFGFDPVELAKKLQP